jgi:hypothetical protein
MGRAGRPIFEQNLSWPDPFGPAMLRATATVHLDSFYEAAMNDDQFNMEVRKFLKKVGVTSQREIERAVGEALADGRLKGDETLKARMTLSIGGLDVAVDIDGDIALE